MVRGICILAAAGLMGVGCASQSAKPQAAESTAVLVSYSTSRAGALVFDPPVAQDQPKVELAREDRTPGVFMGYDETIATYHVVRFDDRQANDFGVNNDRFERRSISYRVGVNYR